MHGRVGVSQVSHVPSQAEQLPYSTPVTSFGKPTILPSQVGFGALSVFSPEAAFPPPWAENPFAYTSLSLFYEVSKGISCTCHPAPHPWMD